MISAAKRLEIGTKLSLKIKVRNVINTASNKDGKTIRELLIPNFLKLIFLNLRRAFHTLINLKAKLTWGMQEPKNQEDLRKRFLKPPKLAVQIQQFFLLDQTLLQLRAIQ